MGPVGMVRHTTALGKSNTPSNLAHPLLNTPSKVLPPPFFLSTYIPQLLPLSSYLISPPSTLPSLFPGYGLLNYRATQAFGSETLYGSYFAAGDTVGVLLDMDHGTLSFFKDGEDFNLGTNVIPSKTLKKPYINDALIVL